MLGRLHPVIPPTKQPKTSTDKNKIKFPLLEGIDPSAIKVLQAAGYTNIESLAGALEGDELLVKVTDAHFVGIRSRTELAAEVCAHAHKLAAVDNFCVGTNRVGLVAAREKKRPRVQRIVFQHPLGSGADAVNAGRADPVLDPLLDSQDRSMKPTTPMHHKGSFMAPINFSTPWSATKVPCVPPS